jgi:hypothetical protein
MAFPIKLEKETLKNINYRNVVYTSPNPKGIQLVLMNLKPNQEIGLEVHNRPSVDQFIKIEHGSAQVVIIENYEDYDKNIELYGNNIMPEQIIEADTLYSSYAMQEFLNTIQSMGR